MSEPPQTQSIPPELRRARRLARFMDASVGVPLTRFRFGFDALVGVVPVLGDAIGAAISAYILAVAVRMGVARSTLLEMLWNIVIEAVGGSVPAVGDVFDAAWRSNVRNVALIERDLQIPPDEPARRPVVVAVFVGLTAAVALGAWVSVRLVLWLLGLGSVAAS